MSRRIVAHSLAIAVALTLIGSAPRRAGAVIYHDVAMDSVAVTSASPLAGSGTITATLHNANGRDIYDTDGVEIGFYLDGTLCATALLGTLVAYEATQLSTSDCNPPLSGSYTILVVADINDVLYESPSDDNNDATAVGRWWSACELGIDTCDANGQCTELAGGDFDCLCNAGYEGDAVAGCSPICGDGLVLGTEACDDGNAAAGDGCSPTCTQETGWTCTGEPSVCTQHVTAACGDGTIDTGEACDDGNTAAGDGCSATCQVEEGSSCAGEPSVCTEDITATCGDGAIDSGEACDDGNTAAGDGCSATCQVEEGYTCAGEPSQCEADAKDDGSGGCNTGGSGSGPVLLLLLAALMLTWRRRRSARI